MSLKYHIVDLNKAIIFQITEQGLEYYIRRNPEFVYSCIAQDIDVSYLGPSRMIYVWISTAIAPDLQVHERADIVNVTLFLRGTDTQRDNIVSVATVQQQNVKLIKVAIVKALAKMSGVVEGRHG